MTTPRLKVCIHCGTPFDRRRPYDYCISCAPDHTPSRVFRQAVTGFKSNGASLVLDTDYPDYMEGVTIRG